MATSTGKPKDTTSKFKKETKVKAALNSQSAVHSKQAKTSLGSPSIKDQRPSSEKKAIPNYLKPTISSRHESFKLRDKPARDDGVSKPVLNRRKSLDMPISISRMEKSFDSPGPRERTTHVRTSSSSLTKSTVAVSGRRSLLNSRESKSFKRESSSPAVYVQRNLNKIGPGSSRSGDDYSSESELQSKVERAENEFPISPQSEEAEIGDYGKVKKNENSLEGDEEDEAKEEEKEIAIVDGASSDCNANEISENKAETEDELREEITQLDHQEDSTKQEKKASEGVGNEEVMDAVSKVGSDYPEEETVVSKEGEEAENAEVESSNRHGQEQGRKEAEETWSATEETKPQAKTVAGEPSNRHGQGHGRKETPAYNDVIEETASKLLEKRKNKVRALVGAFETVIDYESLSK